MYLSPIFIKGKCMKGKEWAVAINIHRLSGSELTFTCTSECLIMVLQSSILWVRQWTSRKSEVDKGHAVSEWSSSLACVLLLPKPIQSGKAKTITVSDFSQNQNYSRKKMQKLEEKWTFSPWQLQFSVI